MKSAPTQERWLGGLLTSLSVTLAECHSISQQGRRLTWAVVRALHMEQMASASSSVFFFTCKSWAAWMRGSRVSLAPLFIRFLSRSHSSSWLTLYLCQKEREGENANLLNVVINVLIFYVWLCQESQLKWQAVFLFNFLKSYQLCLKFYYSHEVYNHNYVRVND